MERALVRTVVVRPPNAGRSCFGGWVVAFTAAHSSCPGHGGDRQVVGIEGTEGVIKGTIGLMYNYPTGRPDTLEFMSKRNPDYWFSARLQSMWIPDAFIGPMASLMCAIEDNSEPESSGRDNLRTLQIVFAEYRSIAEKRAIRPDEITG